VYLWWDSSTLYHDLKIQYYSQAVDLSNTRIVQTATGGNSTFIALTEDERVKYYNNKNHWI